MLRRALTLRWLGFFLVAALLSVGCVLLGQWQWSKYEERSARADRVEAHYEAPHRPVGDVLTTDPVPLDREWTRVTATGTYEADRTVMVRNRPYDGTYGYEVLVPLRLTDGRRVVVDRGWVENSAQGAAVLPDVPAAPAGEVTVTGWVRQGESSLGRNLPAGQVASINLPEVAAQVGGPVLGGYLVLEGESGDPARPLPLKAPGTDTGPHMAYAFQWWLVIPALWAFLVVALRREERESAATTPSAPRPKKVRIWDEEDA